MRIDELMKIALDNKYTIERRNRAGHDEIALYSHHYDIDRQVVRINNETKGVLFISNGSCGVNDLNVIKASIEYAETDPEDREEECAMTSLFKQKIEELGFQTRDNGENYIVANKNGNLMAIVSKKGRKQLNTDFVAWNELSDEKKDMLFDLFIRFTCR